MIFKGSCSTWGLALLLGLFVTGSACQGPLLSPDAGEALVAAARSSASLCSHPHCKDNIILGFANMGYRKFALNWVLSLRLAEVHNFLLVALDEASQAFFVKHGVDSHLIESTRDVGLEAHHHQSSRFMDIMHVRLESTVHILRSGIGVWLTDVDAIFHSDPFLHISPGYQAHLLYDTPFLPDGEKSPLMVMAGCFLMRPCTTFPANCELLKAAGRHQRANPSKHDQYSFNLVLGNSSVEYELLDPLKFVNGNLFFSDRAPQMLGIKPVIVQNNHIVGTNSKLHRFREHLLWFLEPRKHFEPAPKLLVYDNVQHPLLGVEDEIASLRAAFAISRALDRTLVLPLFCIYKSVPGVYEGSPDWCTIEEFLDISPDCGSGVLPYREHSFLLNPRTPRELSAAEESAPKLDVSGQSPRFRPRDSKRGATDSEMREWFGEGTEWANAPVLRLDGVLSGWGGFEDEGEEAEFESKWGECVRVREETSRHVEQVVSNLPPNFTCVHSWGHGGGAERDPAGVMEALVSLVGTDEGVYLALDGMTSDVLEAFSIIWPKAYAFDLYPWVTQGFRRHQHTLLIHRMVCERATSLVYSPETEAGKDLCERWSDAHPGGMCVPLTGGGVCKGGSCIGAP